MGMQVKYDLKKAGSGWEVRSNDPLALLLWRI